MDNPHHRDLAVSLTLPHLRGKQERLKFMAEMTLLAAVDAHGKQVVRGLVRRTLSMTQTPEFDSALRMVAEAHRGPSESTDFGISVIQSVSRFAWEAIQRAEGASASATSPPAFVMGEKIGAEIVGGDLHVTATGALPESAGLTIVPGKNVPHRIIVDPTLGEMARVVANVPTEEGIGATLDTSLPRSIIPGKDPMVAPASLIALPAEMLRAKFVLDPDTFRVAFKGQADGSATVTILAIYRPEGAAPASDHTH